MNAYKLVEEFLNTHQGGGDILLNSVDMGYIEKMVDFMANLEQKVLETGTPIGEVGALPFKFATEIKAGMYQFSPENYIKAMGSSETALEDWNGTDEYDYYWTDTLADQQTLKVERRGNGSLLAVRFDHKNVVNAVSLPVLKNTAGTVTYTAGVDYQIDSLGGFAECLPRGALVTEGAFVKAKYKCVPKAGKYMPLKPGALLSGTHTCQLTSTDPDTGKSLVVYYPKCEIIPDGLLSMGAENFWVQKIRIVAVYDSATPASPLGYVKIEN